MFLPWKTASQTLSLRLNPFNETPYHRFFYFNEHLNRITHQHVDYRDFAYLPESKLGYFTVSFVRNPYDRVYSGFRQLQYDINVHPFSTFPAEWIRSHVLKQLQENLAQLQQANFEFDAWLSLVDEAQIYETDRNSNFPLHPAHYWTHLDSGQHVDFIGRVENFEPDFHEFAERAGIDLPPPVNSNVVDLEGGSDSNPFGYRYVDRMSAASIDKINHLFAEDFRLFGYQKILP